MSDLMGASSAAVPHNSNIPATPITPSTEHHNGPSFASYASPNPMLAVAPSSVPASNSNNPPMPSGNNGPDAVANKIPSLQSNQFKMQRNKSELILCSSTTWQYYIEQRIAMIYVSTFFVFNSFEKLLCWCIQFIGCCEDRSTNFGSINTNDANTHEFLRSSSFTSATGCTYLAT